MLVNEEQFLNAQLPIEINDDGSSILVNDLQYSNAKWPISVTDDGIANSLDIPPGQQTSVLTFLSYSTPSTEVKFSFSSDTEISCKDVQ
jgi:hypothetical protein